MNSSPKKTIFLILYINIFLILFNVLILLIAKNSTNLIENFYSRGLFLYINKPLSYINSYFSFSLGEITIGITLIILASLLVYFAYSLIIKKGKKSTISILLIVFMLLFNLSYYQLAWGLNNYRQDIEEIFEIKDVDVTLEDLEYSYRYLVEETNRLKDILDNNSLNYIDDKYIYTNTYKGYEKLNDEYSFIDDSKVIVKPLMISKFFSASGYTGIYLPFFSEANINEMVPRFSKPFIASHEIAHQKGFASEDDANFMGFLACYYHYDSYFKYSAYQAMMVYVGNSLYKNDHELYREISSLRSESVLNDIKTRVNFWDTHIKEKVNEVHNRVNDTFLKANNQPEGIVNYSKVTELFLKAHKAGIIN